MSDLEDAYAASMDAEFAQYCLEGKRSIIRMEVEADRRRHGQGSTLLTIKASAQLEQRIAAFMVREKIWNRSRAIRVLLAYALNDMEIKET